MVEVRLRRSPVGRPHYQPLKRFHPALALALTALLLNTYAVAAEINRAYESVTYTSNTIHYLLLLIELGLLAAVAGLWLRKASSALLSLAGLSLVGIGYVIWYVYSVQMLVFLTSKPFYRSHPDALPPHLFYLVGGTWFNFVVLLISGALAVREVKRLRGARQALR